jgi:hypothetical protein
MKRLVVALSVLVLASAAAHAREGFGFKKKAVDVMRTVPPALNSGARRVKVEVSSERGGDEDDAKTLTRYVSDAILGGGGTLAESGKPEITLAIELDRLDSHESWETKTEYEYRQTGTQQVWNDSKKKYETKPVYGNVPVTKNIKVVEASLTGSYDIRTKSGELDSGTVDQTFKQKYDDGTGAPAPSRVEDDLLQRAARVVASRIVPTQERVSVLIPRASFEPLIPYAESGDWTRYLAAVEAIPQMKSAKEEAYRQYALAIAKEAVAYATEDRNEALDLLRGAVSHYETAIASNPAEELFRQGYSSLLSVNNIGSPVVRANESVKRYTVWTGSGGVTRIASTQPAAAPPAKSASSGMRNQTVVDLARAGLSDDNIIMAIDAAERVEFDVSPTALITLSKEGVSKGVIAHMQKRTSKR